LVWRVKHLKKLLYIVDVIKTYFEYRDVEKNYFLIFSFTITLAFATLILRYITFREELLHATLPPEVSIMVENTVFYFFITSLLFLASTFVIVFFGFFFVLSYFWVKNYMYPTLAKIKSRLIEEIEEYEKVN